MHTRDKDKEAKSRMSRVEIATAKVPNALRFSDPIARKKSKLMNPSRYKAQCQLIRDFSISLHFLNKFPIIVKDL